MSEILGCLDKIPAVKEWGRALKFHGSKLLPLFEMYWEQFCESPAAEKHHENFTGGLRVHTALVWQTAQAFADSVHAGVVDWTLEELFVGVTLHDFAKIRQYERMENHHWRWAKMEVQQEIWTLAELADFGISVTANELNALVAAEGGYSKFEFEWRPMSVIVHAADLWASQALKRVWNAAEAMKIECPVCRSPMVQRNGPRGAFFGCQMYPACKGTVEAWNGPNPDAALVEWLRVNYGESNA